MSKPITLWAHGPSPNPVKVAIILEELGVPYVVKEEEKIKEEPFISLNPNGRLPAIQDPNFDDFTMFEVCSLVLPMCCADQPVVWSHHRVSGAEVRHTGQTTLPGGEGIVQDAGLAPLPNVGSRTVFWPARLVLLLP